MTRTIPAGCVERLPTPRAIIGESLRWHADQEAIFWVDILGQELRRFDPVTEAYASWSFDRQVAGWFPTERETVLLALGLDLVEFDLASGKILDTLCRLPGNPEEMRLNEGRCDASGRMWISTMGRSLTDRTDNGSLFRIEADLSATRVLDHLAIPNTLCWSPNGRTMYFADSPTRTVQAFDYDLASGEILAPRSLFTLDDATPGIPDGVCVDSEGGLWIAFPRGARVERRMPDGRLDTVIEMPCSRPTMCGFGGPALDTLYISSLSFHIKPEDLLGRPAEGALHSVRVDGARGLPEAVYCF